MVQHRAVLAQQEAPCCTARSMNFWSSGSLQRHRPPWRGASHDARVAVEAGQHVGGRQPRERQPRRDLRVVQHALQFLAHGRSRASPARRRSSPACSGLAARRRRRTGPARCWCQDTQGGASRLARRRAEPFTMSKRNSRHSIGPFHIGTRRDSFSRIRERQLQVGRQHPGGPAGVVLLPVRRQLVEEVAAVLGLRRARARPGCGRRRRRPRCARRRAG